jgi:putative flippase GtrA
MPTFPERIISFAEEHGVKGGRYLVVSAFNLLAGQALLAFLHAGLSFGMVAANLTSVAIGGMPAYLLSRYWVWEKTGKNHLWREVVPFWALLLLGLGISTGLASIADRLSDSTFALMAASIMGFGIVWVGKYFILDQLLFKQEPAFDSALAVTETPASPDARR